ncbi:hypothetical protein B296_00027136 [Ensete ventricosum]|uniref:Condensin complex subunit 1 C-terminal domain-containing protein n=1 Tax=Ensete ventricosum TaxID=4639 RepID=A0A426Z9X1_ENSVE|nr:hypothetical protein B296_00027136 [Ensete ventricosum]
MSPGIVIRFFTACSLSFSFSNYGDGTYLRKAYEDNANVVEATIRPCLVELSEDPDVDVRYFAGQALQACDQVMVSG